MSTRSSASCTILTVVTPHTVRPAVAARKSGSWMYIQDVQWSR
ncbi:MULTISPECIES: hypothetical protein [Streptomyces]|nr:MULTISPECIES: hypothetical protein [Streptomyces]